jgi:hypothetical protein
MAEHIVSSSVPVVALTVSGVATVGLSHLCRSGSSGKRLTVNTYQCIELCVLLYSALGSAVFWVADERPFLQRGGWLHFVFITSSYLFTERLILGILLERADVLSLLPARTRQLKLMYERGFTPVTIFWVLASATNRQSLEDVYATSVIAAWSSLVTFHAVLFLDPSAHCRLAAHVGLPLKFFTLGNLLVHGFPCAVAVASPAERLTWSHGVICAAVHVLWGWYWTGGTFLLDRVYAPLPPAVWRGMWVFAVLLELLLLPCVLWQAPHGRFAPWLV